MTHTKLFKTNQMLEDHKQETKEYLKDKRKDAGVKRDSYKNILPPRYRSYISRANKKRIPFTLTIDEFNGLLIAPCAYCGTSPANTIDRVDSYGGYTQDNVLPSCIQCNTIKLAKDKDAFLRHIKRIYDHCIKPNL